MSTRSQTRMQQLYDPGVDLSDAARIRFLANEQDEFDARLVRYERRQTQTMILIAGVFLEVLGGLILFVLTRG